MRSRRSECTTPRSLSITFGSNARLRRRSASTSNTVASAARGSQSWYTVTSLEVNALLRAPFASSTRSNSPCGRVVVPLNIMCSKKCASPVMPGTSLRLPTCTQLNSAMFGMSWSGQTMTCMPLASVTAWT